MMRGDDDDDDKVGMFLQIADDTEITNTRNSLVTTANLRSLVRARVLNVR